MLLLITALTVLGYFFWYKPKFIATKNAGSFVYKTTAGVAVASCHSGVGGSQIVAVSNSEERSGQSRIRRAVNSGLVIGSKRQRGRRSDTMMVDSVLSESLLFSSLIGRQ